MEVALVGHVKDAGTEKEIVGKVAAFIYGQRIAPSCLCHIYSTYGYSLKIGDFIPENIDFRRFYRYPNLESLTDLAPFLIGVHGDPEKIMFSDECRGYDGVINKNLDCSFKEFCDPHTLHATEKTSLYVIHGIESASGENGNGRTCAVHWGIEKCGPNQCDFNRIIDGGGISMCISLCPVERIPIINDKICDENNIRPYFDAIAAEGTKLIIDLREEGDLGCYREDYHRVDTALSFLAMVGGEDNGLRMNLNEDGKHYCNTMRYSKTSDGGHEIVHVGLRDMSDGGTFPVNGLIRAVKEIDLAAEAKKISTDRMAFHCHGGLGRAPTMMTAYHIWRIAKAAKKCNVELVWDETRQSEFICDGKINLACALRNILILGYYARSTFTQSKAQIYSLVDLCRALADGKIPDTNLDGVVLEGGGEKISFDPVSLPGRGAAAA
jgi:hypothetical protein